MLNFIPVRSLSLDCGSFLDAIGRDIENDFLRQENERLKKELAGTKPAPVPVPEPVAKKELPLWLTRTEAAQEARVCYDNLPEHVKVHRIRTMRVKKRTRYHRDDCRDPATR